jgi:hypothetical protein
LFFFKLEEDIEVDLVIVNPKRKRFAVFEGDFTKTDVEQWVKSVKGGEVKTSKVKKFPKFVEVVSFFLVFRNKRGKFIFQHLFVFRQIKKNFREKRTLFGKGYFDLTLSRQVRWQWCQKK